MDSSDYKTDYKKFSLQKLEDWVQDSINCEDITVQEIYDVVKNAINSNIEYHQSYLDKNKKFRDLIDGINPESFLKDKEHYEGWDSESTKCDWSDFWEENYYPEESHNYTEEELDAMCDKAKSDEEKDQCREYNLREAEYYNKRAELDAKVQAESSYNDGWTREHYEAIVEEFSRNDPTRLKYEGGWVYESPDGGKTVTKRKPGSTEKIVVQKEEKKSWTLPVEESTTDGVKDYYVTFPDDLLKAADLKEGDTVEWIDRKDGSFELRKSLSCPPCPPCDTLACADHLTDE